MFAGIHGGCCFITLTMRLNGRLLQFSVTMFALIYGIRFTRTRNDMSICVSGKLAWEMK